MIKKNIVAITLNFGTEMLQSVQKLTTTLYMVQRKEQIFFHARREFFYPKLQHFLTFKYI